jgi:hypothetical protein
MRYLADPALTDAQWATPTGPSTASLPQKAACLTGSPARSAGFDKIPRPLSELPTR